MKTKKKVRMIVLIILICFILFSLVMAGYMGWGPFSGLNTIRLSNMVGNAEQYSFDAIEPIQESPLAGKNICVLGSSVVYGSASMEYAVGEYLAARLDANLTKEAVSGTTLVDSGENSYVQRLQNNIDPEAQFELFICQLSTNDASKELPLGEISTSKKLEDFDTSTITGALEYIIGYTQETWGCPVVFFTGSRYDNEAYGAMVTRLGELQDKWGIGVLDLWTDDEFNQLSDDMRKIYMSDPIHPTKAGYRDWWGPAMERQLLEYLNH